MKIRKGDNIIVLAGKDRGKTGKVLQVFPMLGRVSVEGINLLSKHTRPQKSGERGQRIQFPSPIAIANVALIDPKTNKPTRVGYLMAEGAKKVRIARRSKEVI